MDGSLVMVLVLATLATVGALRVRSFLQWREMRRALHSDTEYVACVACGSIDLETLADEVYRCRKCAFEGGAGIRAYARRKRDEQIDLLPPEKRRASGIQDVEEAERVLLRAVGLFDAALSESGRDLRDVQVSETQSLAAEAFAEVARARTLLRDARRKLAAYELTVSPATADFLDDAFAVDASIDTFVGDLAVNNKLHQARSETLDLLAAVSRAKKRSGAYHRSVSTVSSSSG